MWIAAIDIKIDLVGLGMVWSQLIKPFSHLNGSSRDKYSKNWLTGKENVSDTWEIVRQDKQLNSFSPQCEGSNSYILSVTLISAALKSSENQGNLTFKDG